MAENSYQKDSIMQRLILSALLCLTVVFGLTGCFDRHAEERRALAQAVAEGQARIAALEAALSQQQSAARSANDELKSIMLENPGATLAIAAGAGGVEAATNVANTQGERALGALAALGGGIYAAMYPERVAKVAFALASTADRAKQAERKVAETSSLLVAAGAKVERAQLRLAALRQ